MLQRGKKRSTVKWSITAQWSNKYLSEILTQNNILIIITQKPNEVSVGLTSQSSVVGNKNF